MLVAVHLFNDLRIRLAYQVIEYHNIATNAKKVGAEQQYGNDLFQEKRVSIGY
jgi:hypothetical protein